MSTAQLNLEQLVGPLEVEISHLLDAGPDLQGHSEAGIIAIGINQIFQDYWEREGQDEDKTGEFLRRLWGAFISLASRIPPEDGRFDMLVLILERLQNLRSGLAVGLGEAAVWEDMPLLGECLHEASQSQFSL